ncbi:MAG: type II secretion system inner membrane protein GspF [Deltaproteobacteria bacterium]|nr:type II secretion system inner membrane protein GspF [Deltaproteobacteria bacterium]
MATYSYKAADSAGKIVTGVLEADEEKKVVAELQNLGLIPIRITPAKGNGKGLGLNVSESFLNLFHGVSSKDVMAFTQDLATLLEAGLPVDRALALLIESAEKERFKMVVNDILKTVQGGGYLSDALAKHPRAFSSFYVSMVRAGEAGGVLEAVLSRLGEFLESAQELKDYIKSAMVYPIFLVGVGGLSIIILLTFVIPKFAIIFSDMGQTIPLSTQLLLGTSHLLQSYWWAILAVLGTGYYFLRKYLKTPAGRLKFDRKKMTFPVVGDLIKKIEVARFARTLGTLTKSGVPILQALMLVKDIMENKVISAAMERVYTRVKEGDRLSKPLRDTGIFPPLAIQMITVGEETGRLDRMLLRVAESYEKMVRNTVKRLISLLEPTMILIMGLVVGFVVVSMLMAVFSMNEMPF